MTQLSEVLSSQSGFRDARREVQHNAIFEWHRLIPDLGHHRLDNVVVVGGVFSFRFLTHSIFHHVV